jgi:hypothetical protein
VDSCSKNPHFSNDHDQEKVDPEYKVHPQDFYFIIYSLIYFAGPGNEPRASNMLGKYYDHSPFVCFYFILRKCLIINVALAGLKLEILLDLPPK